MEQNGGSDAQLFHHRSRSRDAAAGPGTVSRGGCAGRAGVFIQANLELAHSGIPAPDKRAGSGLAKYTCRRATGTAPRPAAGHVLIEIRPATLRVRDLNR